MYARLLPLLAIAACATAPATALADAGSGFATAVENAKMPQRILAGNGAQAFAETCEDWDEWDKPAPPFQILGGTWYVGTCGISSILIADPAGHVLIDSGTDKGAAHVLENIRKIGVDPHDIRYILMSHEHFDHVGGHSALVSATGAKVVASAAALETFRTGLPSAEDPQADAGHPAMGSVKVDRVMADGEVVALTTDPSTSQNRLTAHATPGHTLGALSWTWTACSLPDEPPVCRRIAYVDSLSAVSADDYRFTDHPDLVATFRRSFAKVAALPCDELFTPHPSGSQMLDRIKAGGFGGYGQCEAYARQQEAALDKRLAMENAGG
ncbi:subclass B3 metallo-beta-lactamase [Qipengyuania sp. RANM35]|uniref:subclass B3 metallo-beta-lactamase n=1 Tax=Qipengyuania sp. RANM35 TaxID=3068635 RepID=UPI0034DB59FC